MVQSNEFKGANLAEAVRRATVAYGRKRLMIEHKDICRDLAMRLSDFRREAGRAEDRAEDLQRDAEALAQSARREANEALIGAAVAAAGAFGTAARTLRMFQSLRTLKQLTVRDWAGLIPVIGGAYLAASSALNAVRDTRDAEKLARQADQESLRADQLGDWIEYLEREYLNSGCDRPERVS